MQHIFRYRKFFGLTVLITIFLLNFTPSPLQAVMIRTESVLHPNSEQISDRIRVRAFLRRADVAARMQTYGISRAEALSRIDSLTDREIALIADKIPEAAGNYELDGSVLSIIGLAIYTIFMILAVYFSRTMETEDKPESKKDQDAALTE